MSNQRIYDLYLKYKEVLYFNKNLIIAGISSLLVGSLVTQLYSQAGGSNLINSFVSIATEYSVFFPIFGVLFYIDNRNRYLDPITKKRDSHKLRSDIKKLIATFSVSEIIYSTSKVLILYQLLQLAIISPYQTAILSTILSWMLSAITINIMIRIVKLVRTD
ncbi:MAG: hypothetical protein WBV84_12410 [Nitrososphaeraceae archaeon]|jgi:hypothetical protein